jgi:transposase
MIESDKRKAIYRLHLEGVSIREISRRLKVSRNTVKCIIANEGTLPEITRKDKIEIDPQLLHRLYNACNGWRERVYEKLVEEEGIKIGYSTLTRLLRELGIEGKNKKRKSKCKRRSIKVPDQPGVEMQHDTSPYRIKINDEPTAVVGSLLYLRYCKMRYLKFYRSFNRFKMKCFFHEALTYFGCTACNCIIDNTNLARLRGIGANAVMVLEMSQFADKYGFKFICHEKGHANRKAGNERSFYTVETNFFPGRRFDSLEDLNQQALEWATKRMAQRPVSKSGLIPAMAFEFEQSYLIKLPPYIHPPYRVHYRLIDQYGYVSFDGNFYWIPDLSMLRLNGRVKVKILEYSDLIKVYHKRKLLVQYSLPSEEVKNQRFSPPGQSPKYQPWNRKKPTVFEEKKLRALSPEVEAYLEFALCGKQTQYVKQKHRFIRQLYRLYQKLALPLFVKTISRALNYRITNMETIERIAVLQMKNGEYRLPPFTSVTIDENFKNRESYLEGYSSDEVDLTHYDQLLEEEDEDEEEEDL